MMSAREANSFVAPLLEQLKQIHEIQRFPDLDPQTKQATGRSS